MVNVFKSLSFKRKIQVIGLVVAGLWLTNHLFFGGFSGGVDAALAQASDSATATGAPRIGRSGNTIVYGHAELTIPDGWKVETDHSKSPYVGYTFYPAGFEHFYDAPVVVTITPGLRDAPDRLEPFISRVLDDRELKSDLISANYDAWKGGDETVLSERGVVMSRKRSGAIGDNPDQGALITSDINVIYNKRHVYIAQVGQGVGALIDFYAAKPEEMDAYYPALQSMIASFRFNPQAISEVGSKDRLIAFYSGNGGYWLLYDNGRFASAPHGEYAIPSACAANVCGRFTKNRSSITFGFDDGNTQTARITKSGLTVDDYSYALAIPFAVGTPLNGSYKLDSAVSFSGAYGNGSAYTDNKFTFDGDGHFHSKEKSGTAISLMGQTDFGPRYTGGGLAARDDGTNEGSYTIDGYILTLRRADGFTTKRFIYRAVDKAGNASIAIDGRAYERQ